MSRYHIPGDSMPYDRRELLGQEYVRRINRVLDYVRENLAAICGWRRWRGWRTSRRCV